MAFIFFCRFLCRTCLRFRLPTTLHLALMRGSTILCKRFHGYNGRSVELRTAIAPPLSTCTNRETNYPKNILHFWLYCKECSVNVSLKRNATETVSQIEPCVSANCAVLTGVFDREGRCLLVKTFPISYVMGHISAPPVRRQTQWLTFQPFANLN